MARNMNNQPGSIGSLSSENASLSDRVRSLRIPDRPVSQPVGRWWLPWVLCLLFAVSTAIFAFRSPAPVTTEPEKDQTTESTKQISSLGKSDKDVPLSFGPNQNLNADAILLESKGYVVPVQTIQVSPRVSGMVVQLNIKEGQRVNKGEVLAQLETIEYESDYKRVKGMYEAAQERYWELKLGYRAQEIKQAEAEFKEALSLKDYLQAEWQRNTKLGKTVLSNKEYEQSFSDYKQIEKKAERLKLAWELMQEGPRQEKINAAKAEMSQMEADLVKAKWRLDNCRVEAPISGTILSKKAEEGNIVNPAAFNISASLCDMADLYNLEIDLAIAERDVSKLFKGQKCKIRAEAYPTRTYWGVLSRLMPTADRAKGAIPVRVKVFIPSRLEGIKPDVVLSGLGLLGEMPRNAFGVNEIAALSLLNGGTLEQQGEFLRPEMGALVTFLNQRSEIE